MRSALLTSHNIVTPIQIQTFRNNTPLSLIHNKYNTWSTGLTLLNTVQMQVGNNPIETRLQYYNYDILGNPLELSKTNDVHKIYLWGYNNQYPVAEVTGTNYNTAISYVNQAVLQNPASDQQLRDEIKKITTGLASTNVLVTAYTYAPLIGITSQTDPTGKTLYYEYDGLGRLKLIRDQYNNIVKKLDYQYQQAH